MTETKTLTNAIAKLHARMATAYMSAGLNLIPQIKLMPVDYGNSVAIPGLSIWDAADDAARRAETHLRKSNASNIGYEFK